MTHAKITRNEQVGYSIDCDDKATYGFAFTLRGARRRAHRQVRRAERRQARKNSVNETIHGRR